MVLVGGVHRLSRASGAALLVVALAAQACGTGLQPDPVLTRSAAPVGHESRLSLAASLPSPTIVTASVVDAVIASTSVGTFAPSLPDDVLPAAAAQPSPPSPPPASPTPAPPPPAEGEPTDPAPPQVVNRPPPRPDREAGDTPSAPPPPSSRAVHPDDFPDPYVFRSGAHWYAVSTQRGLTQVPVMRSLDLRTWERLGDALPRLPDWAEFGHVWAPSVMTTPTGFTLLYTTRHRATGLQCISRAVGVLPEGPYLDTSSGPLVCQWERGGSIDPDHLTSEDGSRWLIWKSEGTLDGEATRIWSQRFNPSLERLVDDPNELLVTDERWEGPIIEGPSMVVEGGRHHLLYSANRWETARYATGHAVCDGPAGPCRRTSRSPVLATDLAEAGPGGGTVLRDLDGSLRFAYHAWEPAAVAYPAGARRLHLARLTFDGDRAVVTRGL